MNSPNLKKVKSFVLNENPPNQIAFANSLKCSVPDVNIIVNSHLNFQNGKKYNVHCHFFHYISPDIVHEAEIFIRIIYPVKDETIQMK